MKLSDIITTRPAKTMLGRGVGHIASINGADYVSCSAKTADEAQAKLIELVAEHFRHGHTRRYYFSPSGKTTFVLYHVFGGWCYDIIRPGMTSPSTCSMAANCALDSADKSVRRHAEDYIEEETPVEPGTDQK